MDGRIPTNVRSTRYNVVQDGQGEPAPPTKLLGAVWSLREGRSFRIATIENAHIEEIDRDWPRGRRPGDWNESWHWHELVEGKPEAFVVLDAMDRPAAIWCSGRRSPLVLASGRFYRLDFLEVAPGLRGTDVGFLAFSLVAARALELKANGIVLETWPPLRRFYTGLGGIEGKPAGWNLADNLVPFTFQIHALEDLVQALETKKKSRD